jgi:hypothetical protein
MSAAAPRADIPRYRAFISYNHLDRAIAVKLHARLERYLVPRLLVGRPSEYGKVPKRLYPIFLDREELSSSSRLSQSIQIALRDSSALIVVCSPHSARSRWVNEEIAEFTRLGRAQRIFAVIVDGVPNAADEERECFPKTLRSLGVFGGDEPLDEPLAADLRPDQDGWDGAILKLVAGVLGLELSELTRREQRAAQQRARLRSLIIGVIVALMGLALSGAIVADRRSTEAEVRLEPGVEIVRRATTLDMRGWQETSEREISEDVKKSKVISHNEFLVERTGGGIPIFVHRMRTTSSVKPEVDCNGCEVRKDAAEQAAWFMRMLPFHDGAKSKSASTGKSHEWRIVFDISHTPEGQTTLVKFAVTFWNAFQRPDQWWGGFRVLHPTRHAQYSIVFPAQKRPFEASLSYYYVKNYAGEQELPYVPEQGDSRSSETDPARRVTSTHWILGNPGINKSYRIKWRWER